VFLQKWGMSFRVQRDGFSIVEVMMATTILLVGFIGLIQALTITSESLDTARKQQVAQQIVAGEIEKLRGRAWSNIANLPATGTIAVGSAGALTGDLASFALSNYTATTSDDNLTLARLANGFTCALARTYLRPSGATATNATYVKLVYTVTWTSATGRSHRHTFETYLGKSGLHLSYQQS
jgi:Tfp pilus assembly protein PilV